MARLTAILCTALLCGTALGGVVGSGTPSSCTEAALTSAIAAGGTVTFNCGAGPQTIPITFAFAIGPTDPTVIFDGGDTITLDGTGVTGGMLYVFGGSAALANATFRHITFANGNINTGLNAGGTIQNTGNLTLDSVTFRNSHAPTGGVIFQELCTGCLTAQLTVTHCLFQNNDAGSGAAIGMEGGNATIEDSTFTGNTADGGAAIDVFSNATFKVDMSIDRCTFSGNTAKSYGGGAILIELLNAGSSVRISNSTFTGNTAPGANGQGAAINAGAAPVSITNCTIAGNTAGPSGGAVYFGPRTPITAMNNTIIANNSGGNCGYSPGAIFIGGHNLQFGDSTCTGAAVADPLLQPLADNGGPTNTMALGANSPAIDAGDSDLAPPTDQRGMPRTDGNHDGVFAADIGAFEAPGPTAPPPAPRRHVVKH
jgi:predicted outer membrane repeat protein